MFPECGSQSMRECSSDVLIRHELELLEVPLSSVRIEWHAAENVETGEEDECWSARVHA